jgi:UDP-glucose 4-epimerase
LGFYVARRVLVTGGLGFIGSNLAIRLVQLGASVTIVDSCIEGCGGNLLNIAPVSRDVRVAQCDISNAAGMRPLLKGIDVVFNLAGEISHSHSMEYPDRDLEINLRSQMLFLRECSERIPGVRIVYAGTRQVYGRPEYLPVDESHPVAPVDYNGVSKHAAAEYHLMLTRAGLLDAAVMRLTNTYGPRLAVNVPCQGVLSVFFMRLLLGLPLEIFGDGGQLRDPVYVDDVVDAMLRAGAAEKLQSRVFNVGGPAALPLGEIGGILSRLAGTPQPMYRPFPREARRIDIGSFFADSSRIRRELEWQPHTSLEHGAALTLRYFQQHLHDYLDPADAYPECHLRRSIYA